MTTHTHNLRFVSLFVTTLGCLLVLSALTLLPTPKSVLGGSVANARRAEGITSTLTISDVGRYDTAGTAMSLQVVGQRAYVADGANGLVLLDVSVPTTPTLLSTAAPPSNTTAMEVQVEETGDATIAYVRLEGKGAGVAAYDVGDPASPLSLGSYQAPLLQSQVEGALAYLIVGDALSQTLEVVDFTTPTTPTLVSQSAPLNLGLVRDMQIVGSTMYLVADYTNAAAWENALYLFDISDPAAPVQISSLASDTYHQFQSIVVKDSVAYLSQRLTRYSCGFQGLACKPLKIVDVSDPLAPQVLGSYSNDSISSAGPLLVQGSYVLQGTPQTIDLISVADPTTPHAVATHPTLAEVQDLAAGNGLILAAEGESGVQLLRLEFPYTLYLPIVRADLSCANTAPPLEEGVQIWAPDEHPAPNSYALVCTRLTLDGTPIEGAVVKGTYLVSPTGDGQYREFGPLPTGPAGVAATSLLMSSFSGFGQNFDIIVEHQGQSYGATFVLVTAGP